MSAFAIMTVLAGATLGLRFKVLILLPAMLAALLVAIALGTIAHAHPGASLLSIALGSIGLQLGYLGGATLRYVIAASRAGRLHHVGMQHARALTPRDRIAI